MIGTGLALPQGPSNATVPTPAPAPPPAAPNMSLGGVVSAQSLGSMLKQAKLKSQADSDAAAEKAQQAPGITGLAGHIKAFWEQAKEAKRPIEVQMLEALYARRGEYTAEKLATIQAAGQPAIYMMLAASKMRQVGSLLHDTLVGAGTEKPWTLDSEPVPDLPPILVAQIKAALTQELEQAIQAGADPSLEDVRQRMMAVKEQQLQRVREEARAGMERMEDKMETQLDEGGFNEALDGFITDLTTFKAAFIAGPIIRKKPKLVWVQNNPVPVVQTTEMMEWERVSPFDMYPAPWARNINEGSLIRKHKLTREALNDMIGVEGFNEDSIRRVLDLYGIGGLNEWLSIDNELARAEGKLTTAATIHTGLIDALQYWGSVSGKMLREWGMTAKAIPDQAKEYQVEAWLIGPYVIKAALNVDPLARRPFYSTSYERVPGTVWGNAPYDLMADCQDMCNAAARSLAANLGISSGPQVVVNVSRLPTGESVSDMYPWKIWQVEEAPMAGTTQAPITFFQPSSNAAELMGVYEKFSTLADEYTGIPKYMTGSEGTPGAGRTASGLSMMIGNASKIVKQVIGSVDLHILTPLLERLYYTNMRYASDPDLKRAVSVVARGAASLTTKEAAQVRRNEFLAATNNPTDIAIIGTEGRAEVLRSVVQTLDMNPDKIIPPVAVLKEKQKMVQQAQAAAAAQAQEQPGASMPGGSPGTSGAPGTPGNMPPQSAPGQQLMNGAPTTDNFNPTAQPA